MYQLLVNFWEFSFGVKMLVFALLVGSISGSVILYINKAYTTHAEREHFVNNKFPLYGLITALITATILWTLFSDDFNLFATNYLK